MGFSILLLCTLTVLILLMFCFAKAVTDPEIKKEIAAYYEGKRRLAIMMGCDPDTFTEKDVDVRSLCLLVYKMLKYL